MNRLRAANTSAAFAFALLVLCAYSWSSYAMSAGMVVVQPQVRPPYDRVYQEIIMGFNKTYTTPPQTVLMLNPENAEKIGAEISRINPDLIMALGSRSASIARQYNANTPKLAGAVSQVPEGMHGITMWPDPQLVLERLIIVYGKPKTIYLVTDIDKRQSQITGIKDFAQISGFKASVHHADNIKDAAAKYQQVLGQLQPGDAIWLMRDKALNDPSLLSLVLETAWKNKVAVISSNPVHVKRGALMAIFPNNQAMGESLGRLATRVEQDGADLAPIVEPLTDVHTSLNNRTSRHLGITLSSEANELIDSVF